jgi:hypothetical protein
MAEAIGISQAAIAVANTEESLYIVPGSTYSVVSSIVICNRSNSPVTYRWAVVPGGGAAGNANWNEYDETLLGNEPAFRTLGVTLPTGAEVRIRANSTDVSFSLYYVEVT